jgi:hypothetical protein
MRLTIGRTESSSKRLWERVPWISLEEIVQRHIEELCDAKQQIGSNALFARLVGADLVAINSECRAKLLFGYAEPFLPNAQSAPDPRVNGAGLDIDRRLDSRSGD